jgi:hypothetical protein
MNNNLKQMLKFLKIVFVGFYALILTYGIYNVGLEKTIPWIFFGTQLIAINLALKSRKIFAEMDKMPEEKSLYARS